MVTGHVECGDSPQKFKNPYLAPRGFRNHGAGLEMDELSGSQSELLELEAAGTVRRQEQRSGEQAVSRVHSTRADELSRPELECFL